MSDIAAASNIFKAVNNCSRKLKFLQLKSISIGEEGVVGCTIIKNFQRRSISIGSILKQMKIKVIRKAFCFKFYTNTSFTQKNFEFPTNSVVIAELV